MICDGARDAITQEERDRIINYRETAADEFDNDRKYGHKLIVRKRRICIFDQASNTNTIILEKKCIKKLDLYVLIV